MDFIDIQKKDDEKIAMLFSAFFSYNLITLLINTLVNFVLPNTPIDTAVCTLVYAVFIFMAIGPIARNLTMTDFGFIFLCFFVYIAHMLLYPDNFYLVLKTLPKFIFTILPLYLLGKSIKNYKKVLQYFEKVSKGLVWVAFGYYIILIISGQEMRQDNMSFSYYLLPFVIIRFYTLISSFSIRNLLYFAVAVVTLVLTGTRGPFLCLIIGIILFMLFYQQKRSTKVIWTFILIGFVIFLFSDAFISMLERINSFLLNYNIENRIIEKFLEEEMLNSSGREHIIASVINAIKQKPILGSGILSDRVKFGTYAHNFFYELLLHFGCIVGLIIFSVVTIMVFKAVYGSSNSSYKTIAILCVSCIYVKLFVSGSYIEEPIFFLMLGIISSKKFIVKDTVHHDKESA